ncbi:hypothetical protein BpHYR1_037247 [Brachionus plicatilis]|uniref:Uncharacterized protein n=1 Tax=Brachionus plicatilis TaxID=10195 RepID=A0A3M7QQF2_BRAPC|nr:hypothetical protein BpHYR1_037247 [Brachionus plicatilis]
MLTKSSEICIEHNKNQSSLDLEKLDDNVAKFTIAPQYHAYKPDDLYPVHIDEKNPQSKNTDFDLRMYGNKIETEIKFLGIKFDTRCDSLKPRVYVRPCTKYPTHGIKACVSKQGDTLQEMEAKMIPKQLNLCLEKELINITQTKILKKEIAMKIPLEKRVVMIINVSKLMQNSLWIGTSLENFGISISHDALTKRNNNMKKKQFSQKNSKLPLQ